MSMNTESMDDIKYFGGIYAIMNIPEWKVYVGKAKTFNERDHAFELDKGIDSRKLQRDYDSGVEFIYMVLYIKKDLADEQIFIRDKNDYDQLNELEQMYMTLLEEFGFDLYNEQCNNYEISSQNRSIENLNIKKSFYEKKKMDFIDDIRERFKMNPEELSKHDRRKEVFENYVKKYLDKNNQDKCNQDKSLYWDRIIFNRQRIQRILYDKSISIKEIDIKEMFISIAGNYVGDNIDQILNYERKTIDENGYCLWTFSANSVSAETVKQLCKERQEQEKDVYVLFIFTTSNSYAKKNAFKYNILRKKYVSKLSGQDMEFLKFDQMSYGHFSVPDGIDCTASGGKNVKAFVISELYLLDEVCDKNELEQGYVAVRENGVQEIKAGGWQRSTQYVMCKDENFDNNRAFKAPTRREFCFLGKLASPYILTLERENV